MSIVEYICVVAGTTHWWNWQGTWMGWVDVWKEEAQTKERLAYRWKDVSEPVSASIWAVLECSAGDL